MRFPSPRIDREPRALPLRSAVEAALRSVRDVAGAKGIVLEVPSVQEWVVAGGEGLAQVVTAFFSTVVELSPPKARVRVKCETVAEHVQLRMVDEVRSSILCLPAAAAAPTDPFLFAPRVLSTRERLELAGRAIAA